MQHRVGLFLLVSVLFTSVAAAEQWPSNNILFRVLFIKVGTNYGRAFTLERGGKQYLVTARHMVDKLPRQGATVEIYTQEGSWKKFTGDLIFPDKDDIDIAVFTLPRELTTRLEVGVGAGVTIGQEGYFFGYPYGLHTDFNGGYVAFVKSISVSAITKRPNATPFLYLDGFNNPGFSGGPVAFYNYQAQRWDIVAVISGFQPEKARKKVGSTYVYTDTLVNSGIVIAHFIQPALDALDKYIAQQK